MGKIKVLVVDDSAFMRKVIADIVNSDPFLEVVGKAHNGDEAISKITELDPDVVTMDVEMPGTDGLSALARIMGSSPVPIIMLSSLTQNGAEQTLKALQLGAVDFIAKPSGQISLDIDKISQDIIRKIKVAAGTKKKLKNFNNIASFSERKIDTIDSKLIDLTGPLDKLVLIGTSTGGPKALHQLIPEFPARIDAGILIVQHMPAGFTRSLAERLDSISEIRVKEAEHGEKIVAACAYIAPGDYHLTVTSRKGNQENELYINLDKSAPRGGHRPSVDVMLESVAEQYWSRIVCVIMTGMGRDGADGVKAIKDRAGKLIAEDQSTCIVYGMPKAAVDTGMVDKVLPLNNIGEEVLKMLQ